MDSSTAWNNVLSIIFSFIQVGLQIATVLYISKVQHKLWQVIISVVIVQLFYYGLAYFLHHFSLIVILLWLFSIMVNYKFMYKQTWRKSFAMTLGHIVCVCILEILVQLLLLIFGGTLHDNLYTDQTVVRLVTTVAFCLLFFLARKFGNRLQIIDMSKETNILWIAHVLFLFLFTVPFILSIERRELIMRDSLVAYLLLIFIIFFIYNVTYIRSLGKMSNISQQLETLQLYAGSLEESYESLRGFKHDFLNIVSTIDGYIEMDNFNAIKTFFAGLNREALAVRNTQIINEELKKTPILYGIFLSKLSLAELNGINFDINIPTEIKPHYCELLDFSRIIGNLLDNAMDAAMKCEGDNKFVSFEVHNKFGRQYITIRNSCIEDVDVSKIFRDGYTSKPRHMGKGLAKVNEIIKKYNKKGYALELKSSCNDHVFSQTLIV